MMISQQSFTIRAGAVAASLFFSTAAFAQSDTGGAIDALVEASVSNEAALQTAETQVTAGDLTGAATTLERRLIDEPDATSVRIRYAVLLCELDDRQAAQYELRKIASEPIDDASKTMIAAKCGAAPTAVR